MQCKVYCAPLFENRIITIKVAEQEGSCLMKCASKRQIKFTQIWNNQHGLCETPSQSSIK